MFKYESIASDATCDRARMNAYKFKSASQSTPNITYVFFIEIFIQINDYESFRRKELIAKMKE